MNYEFDYTVPSELKGLRACIRCGLVKTAHQFADEGCENCPFLGIERGDNAQKCTTPHYEGIIALLEPEGSWVAKWHGIVDCIPGLYAIQVLGKLPEEFIQRCEDAGVVPRATAKPK